MAIKTLFPKRKNLPVSQEDENPFSLLRREMDALFDNFFRGFGGDPSTSHPGTFDPSVDVMESDKEIIVFAELPGMDEKDIEVSVQKESLTIKGDKKGESEDRERYYYRMERSYGSFGRTIPLPVEVDLDKVAAQFRKGVLKVTLPKTSRTMKERKRINLKVE